MNRDRRRVNNVRQKRYYGCVNVPSMGKIRSKASRRFIGASWTNRVTQDIRCQVRAVVRNVPKQDDKVSMVTNGASRVGRRRRRHGAGVCLAIALRVRPRPRYGKGQCPARVRCPNGRVNGEAVIRDGVLAESGSDAICERTGGKFFYLVGSFCVGKVRLMVKVCTRPIVQGTRCRGQRRHRYRLANYLSNGRRCPGCAHRRRVFQAGPSASHYRGRRGHYSSGRRRHLSREKGRAVFRSLSFDDL